LIRQKGRSKVGLIGGTDVGLLRLLAMYPQVELRTIASRAEAGKPVAELFLGLRGHPLISMDFISMISY